MSKLQVLVTTMHQTDMQKYHDMNLQTDAVIANQADKNEKNTEHVGNSTVQMITTDTRGVSKNRNIAMKHINPHAEYVMFSDDDLRFYKDYEYLVVDEFINHPEADAIKFNLNSVSDRKIGMKTIKTFHKTNRREVGGWGVWGLVFKADVLRRINVCFNERFGTGTHIYCGEDTIFLQELLKKRIRLYASPVCIGDIDQSVSSWFNGYDERYFMTNGMILYEIYPTFSYLLVIRSAWRFIKRPNCTLTFWNILKCYYKGIAKIRRERK